MSRLIGELTSQPFVLPVMLTGLIWLYWKKKAVQFFHLLSVRSKSLCIAEFWSEIPGEMQLGPNNSHHACNVFLLLTISAISSKQLLFWILYNPRFKSYLSYKFDQPEPICDQTKMNLAGVRRLSRNYFEPCNYTFNYYALNDIKIKIKCIYIESAILHLLSMALYNNTTNKTT